MDVFNLTSPKSGILHIFPTSSGPQGIAIRAGPLKCRQQVVRRSECLFELTTDSEHLTINVAKAVKSAKGSAESISFSFRTDRPTSSFLSATTENGEIIQVDLIDGRNLYGFY